MIQSQINPTEWLLEVERVAGKLKYNTQSLETKEWRQHIDHAHKYKKYANKELNAQEQKLQRITDDIGKVLERVQKREQQINKNMTN